MTDSLPAIFFGHGNPMNALMRNSYTEGWRASARAYPDHDFGGFPRELYQVQVGQSE